MNRTAIVYGPYGYVIGTQDTISRLCQCGMCSTDSSATDSTDKRTVTLLFNRDDLIYDIENIAYVTGDNSRTDDAHAAHQLQDIAQDGNVDRITRTLDLVHAICVEALYPFTKSECDDGLELSDTFAETPVYSVTLSVPTKKFSLTTAKLLEQLIHELLVCYALADWFAIVGRTDLASLWSEKAASALAQVKDAIGTAKTGVTTRPLHPW